MAKSDAQSEWITLPQSEILLEELHFLPGQQEVAQADPRVHRLCRGGRMMPDYSGISMGAWTGTIFRRYPHTNDQCAFSVQDVQHLEPTASDIETADCVSQISIDGDRISSIRVYVKEHTSRHFFQCEYRLTMAFVGFAGALAMPEEELFVASDEPWILYNWPIRQAFSSIMPAPYIHLQRACRLEELPFRPPAGTRRSGIADFYRQSNCEWDR